VEAAESGGARDAEPHFRDAVRADPQFAPAHHELGRVLWDLGRREEAVQAYQQALAVRPDSAMTHNNLGAALTRMDDLAGAAAELQAALASADDPAAVAYAHISMGNWHRTQDDFMAAEREYEGAQRLMPKHPAALLNSAVIPMLQAAETRRELKRAKDTPRARELRAQLKREYDATEALLRRVTAVDSDRRATADAYRLLGHVYLYQRRFAQTIVECEQALEVRPDYASACLTLGVAYKNLNRHAEAEEAYRRAIELNSDPKTTARAHNSLGVLLKQLNRRDEAGQHLRTASQLDPDNDTIEENLREFEAGR